MKVLILGGDGFIGSNLAKKHNSLGHQVTVVDKNDYRSNGNLIQKDITFPSVSSVMRGLWGTKRIPDLVYNCIAVATPAFYVQNPLATFDLDFMVNKEILDFLHTHKIPCVHFSSSEVYGKTWTETYTEESNCTFGSADKQRWIYATSKLLLDQYILASGMDCCILRPFNFCGADMDWLEFIPENNDKRWIPRLPACFMNNLIQRLPLNVVLPGTQRRCYTYIGDAVEGILSIVNNWSKCSGEIINVGNTQNETTILDMAKLFIQYYSDISGDDPITIKYIDGIELYGNGYEDSERRLFSDDKMIRLTGWRAKIDLESTVRLTIENSLKIYFNYINAYRKQN